MPSKPPSNKKSHTSQLLSFSKLRNKPAFGKLCQQRLSDHSLTECNEFDIMGLRCYSDDDNFLKFVSGKCDEITSVNFNNIDNKITIYPNPGHDHVTIQMNTDVSLPLRYQIIDVCGRVMEMGNRNHDHWTQATGHLISGLYIISILDAKGRHWTNKWTKQ